MSAPKPPLLNGVHAALLLPFAETTSQAAAEEFDAVLELVDRVAVQRVSIGDHQGNHLESYSGLGYVAARTRRVDLGAYVTNPVTRDPGVHAAALASLDALSRGRAYVVMGRGDGVVKNLDLEPATVAQARDAIRVIRTLLISGEARHGGRHLRLRWAGTPGDRVRLYLAAGGPRILRAAVQVADGAYLATGLTAADVDATLFQIDEAHRASGRTKPFDVWWVTRFAIGETYEEALDTVAESLSSMGNHTLRDSDYEAKRVPRALWPALREYHARYDWSRKSVVGAGPNNADLMTELGLLDYFLDRFAIVGTPGQVIDRMRELASRGVDQVVLNIRSLRQLQLLSAHVLPHVTGLPAATDRYGPARGRDSERVDQG